MIFSSSKGGYNEKKTQAFRESLAKPHLHRGGVVCTTCQKPLSDEDSMSAGMGPVCLERSRFAEHVGRENLIHLEAAREPLNKGLYPSRTAILKLKQENLGRFVTFLSADSNQSLMIDRSEMNEAYSKTGSIAEAIVSSLYNFEPHEGEYISALGNPKDADLARDFKKFQKHVRETYKERSDFIRANPFVSYYNQVQSKKGLSESQLEAREKLLADKENQPEIFQDQWGKGKVHLSTWIKRLKSTQLSEARILADALEVKSKSLNMEIKDFGLTDQEIEAGLHHSHQALEKHLFKSFIEGSTYLMIKVDLYKRFKDMELSDKMATTKIFAELSQQKPMTAELKASIKGVLSKYKISERGLL